MRELGGARSLFSLSHTHTRTHSLSMAGSVRRILAAAQHLRGAAAHRGAARAVRGTPRAGGQVRRGRALAYVRSNSKLERVFLLVTAFFFKEHFFY